ncbi:hypothetical protein CCM_03812 [Cordyceps militaris CM01]|uniref:Uncharacterized protein n=1 Tax=Cordyceps militaris (strain CM01) TaxID=983644 RepID=G3JGS5_CORMM|nr:uncharacterized protein CCM_03812 [Cordyceps militaris CM01]EGX92439.1 hypothetical protein CCM_03812 [Cordyceps militaris CM01]
MQQKHNSPPSSELLSPQPAVAAFPSRLRPAYPGNYHAQAPSNKVALSQSGAIANAPGNVLVIPSRPRKIINRAMVAKASGAETGAVAGAFQDNTQRFLVAAM